ncbi:hypothetical protein CKAH01_01847 [Colletotrichum kahawae]|uniref:Clr5 domain-containing protein n=1 Tax=Colletotrichum kahawae TaxID=34407 RepID=A0AAE0D2I0_COLKA|nr:hypothetical protein CKAH01_01847 [Colletotrichum kahawae]
MYKKKFAAWGFSKNQSQCRPVDSMTQILSGTSDRARSAKSLPQKQFQESQKLAYRLDKHLSLLAPDDPKLAQLEKMLYNVWGYFMRVFDRESDGVSGWTGDFFGLIPPEGHCDFSGDWKAVSDQCDGASILVAGQDDTNGKCQKTLHKALSVFDNLLQKKDPWMLVYIWRVILYMRGNSFRLEPKKSNVSSIVLARNRNDHLVGNVLTGIIGLIKICQEVEHPMVHALESLRFFCLQDMKLAVERVYQLSIDLFMDYLGNFHPVVLSMTGHFLKYWPGKLGEHVLPSYNKVVESAEAEFGVCAERTTSLLTEYMYAANYHSQDSSLTFKLATNLKERTDRLGNKPSWRRETYAHVLACKLLARLNRDEGKGQCWMVSLGALATRLRNGDRECQTRALQIRLMLASWYRRAGENDRCEIEKSLAEGIRARMSESEPVKAGWNETFRFRGR